MTAILRANAVSRTRFREACKAALEFLTTRQLDGVTALLESLVNGRKGQERPRRPS